MTHDDRLDDANRYGFRWGPMSVVRAAMFGQRRVLSITTDGTNDRLSVYVSPTGRSVRVFRNGKELR
jgi:hypothetical protein